MSTSQTQEHDRTFVSDDERWLVKAADIVPRLRDESVLIRMPSFVLLMDRLYGEKRTLSPAEATVVALCNGAFTVADIVSAWEGANEAASGSSLPFVRRVLTENQEHLVAQPERRLEPFRYRAADFVYDSAPVAEDRTEPYAFPVEAVLAITNRCNMRCIYCYRSSGAPLRQELTTRQVIDAIDQSADLGVVRCFVTGGEPFTRPDLVPIVCHALDRGLFPYMSTNGSLVTPEAVAALGGAGLRVVQVSLDTVEPDTFRLLIGTDIALEVVERSIRLFADAGVQVVIKAVITSHNWQQIEQLIDRCAELGVTRVGTEAFGGSVAGRGGKELACTTAQAEWLEETVARKRDELKGVIYIEGFRLLRPWQTVRDIVTCGGMHSGFAMQPNGDVVVCENLGDLPEFVFGNLTQQPLAEIWGSEAVLNFLNPEPERVDARCRACASLPMCRTGCYNRSLYEHGDLWGPDPNCPILHTGQYPTPLDEVPAAASATQ